MIELDGAEGEGGGQILRSALALSMASGQPFRMRNIRAGRAKPGLLRQHLTAVRAAEEIGGANLEGAELGSQSLTFRPGGVRPGRYAFSIGAAGSTTLVFQAVWPALALAGGPSELTIEGGTHNPAAPPFDFLAEVLAPVIARTGTRITPVLERHGFYPAGGGRLRVTVEPGGGSERLELIERGAWMGCELGALVSQLSRSIGAREVAELRRLLEWNEASERIEEVPRGLGPGNVAWVRVEHTHIRESFTGFGLKGVRAEEVAEQIAKEVRAYLSVPAPVGPHLADQLLVPLALGGGGTFRTVPLTGHTHTQIWLLRELLGVEVAVREGPSGTIDLTVPAGRLT